MGGVALTDSVKPGATRLVIYRTSALAFAVQPNYLVDGRVIGGSQPAGFVVCDLPPGRHEVAVNNMPFSNVFGHGSEKMSIDLRAGSTAYFSADPQMGIVTPGQITLVQVTENQGRTDVTTNIVRNAAGLPTQITDPLGHSTTFSYDDDGNSTDITDRDGRHTQIGYNADNQPTGRDPMTEAAGSARVIRGGSWWNGAFECRSGRGPAPRRVFSRTTRRPGRTAGRRR